MTHFSDLSIRIKTSIPIASIIVVGLGYRYLKMLGERIKQISDLPDLEKYRDQFNTPFEAWAQQNNPNILSLAAPCKLASYKTLSVELQMLGR